ncbi:MAG: hypothetical protein KBD78_09400 [Oligoflexales bacterium]|nr:hypothetical protein [Oligoflexales bacterium]
MMFFKALLVALFVGVGATSFAQLDVSNSYAILDKNRSDNEIDEFKMHLQTRFLGDVEKSFSAWFVRTIVKIFDVIRPEIKSTEKKFPNEKMCGNVKFDWPIVFKQNKRVVSQDPDDYRVNENLKHCIKLSEATFVLEDIQRNQAGKFMISNNNVALTVFKDKLFLALRTAQIHFPSATAELHIYSTQNGSVWNLEKTIKNNENSSDDFREPFFIDYRGKLYFTYFRGAGVSTKFEPIETLAIEYDDRSGWSDVLPKSLFGRGFVPWHTKFRKGQYWQSAYNVNQIDTSDLATKQSLNYLMQADHPLGFVANDAAIIDRGGISEMTYEIDGKGDMWFIGRNDIGDVRGFGTIVGKAENMDLDKVEFNKATNPVLTASPRTFQHNGEIYLIGRRSMNVEPFGSMKFLQNPLVKMIMPSDSKTRQVFSFLYIWARNWLSPQTTSLYWLDRQKRDIVHLTDLPGAGDTAFPSIFRLSENRFIIANYTSPLENPLVTWSKGQIGYTSVYLQQIEFQEQ